MKRDYLKETIDDCTAMNGVPYSYFLSYKETDNIVSNEHGKFCELESALDRVEMSMCCIEGNLPIEMLVIYYNTKAIIFIPNPCWDCVEDPSYESHLCNGIPLMDTEGGWLYITGSTDTVYLSEEELCGDKRK